MQHEALLIVLAMPTATAMLAACLWASYLVALRAAGPAPPHARAAATALVALWLSTTVFTALAALHLFRLVVAAPLWILGATAAHATLGGPAAARTLARDLQHAKETLATIPRSIPRILVALAGLTLVGARLFRDLVSPPLAWDSLVYHLFRPARWIQEGAVISSLGPDAWRFLEYFPHAGDVPWAWAMLPVHSDALIAPTGVLVWSSCILGGYALARALGAAPLGSAMAGLAIGLIPAAANSATSGYADNFVLGAFLLSGAAIVLFAEAPSRGRAALAGGGLGLVAAGKLSGLPMLGLGLAFLAWLAARPSRNTSNAPDALNAPRRAPLELFAAGCAAAVAVALPGYLRALMETGSPFYPLTVTVAHKTLFAGNPELQMLYEGRLHDLRSYDDSIGTLFASLTLWTAIPGHEHLGFGWGAFGLLPLGALGIFSALRRPGQRAVTLMLVTAALLPFVGLLSPAFLAHRTIWIRAIGRLLMALPATLAVFGARIEGRVARGLWIGILAASAVACVPQGMSQPALEGMRELALPLALAGVIAVLAGLALARLRRPFVGAAVAALLFSAAIATPLMRIRSELRYRIFAAHTGSDPAYEMHTLEPSYASSFPIWRALDDGVPHRIALAAGWDGIGHNCFRYPLTGSHLQNRVVYIPVSRDGAVFDYMHEEEVFAQADFDAWLSRLVTEGIDVVVTLHPSPIEQLWMEANPELFEPMATSTEGWNIAFRFHRERLDAAGHAPI